MSMGISSFIIMIFIVSLNANISKQLILENEEKSKLVQTD